MSLCARPARLAGSRRARVGRSRDSSRKCASGARTSIPQRNGNTTERFDLWDLPGPIRTCFWMHRSSAVPARFALSSHNFVFFSPFSLFFSTFAKRKTKNSFVRKSIFPLDSKKILMYRRRITQIYCACV